MATTTTIPPWPLPPNEDRGQVNRAAAAVWTNGTSLHRLWTVFAYANLYGPFVTPILVTFAGDGGNDDPDTAGPTPTDFAKRIHLCLLKQGKLIVPLESVLSTGPQDSSR